MKDGRTTSSTRRPVARPRLFISYRRRFDVHSARLLKQELARAFGDDAVFRDVDDIEAGEAFPEAIAEAIEASDVFLLLVSPGWLESVASLHSPEDFVRREIAAALARQIPLVPVLLGDARMPKADELPPEIKGLAFRQAIELSDERWDYDVARLVKVVGARAALTPHTFLGTWLGKAAAIAAVGVLAAAVYAAYRYNAALLINGGGKVKPTPRFETVTYAGCLDMLRRTDRGPHEATVDVKLDNKDRETPIVWVDQYKLVSSPPPEGFPILIRLTDDGRDVGAVLLVFLRGDYPKGGVAFRVWRVVKPPCAEVTDYFNQDSKAKSEVYNWDGLSLRLGEFDYYRLRLGDHGDSLLATLKRETPE
jgi:hypothetical protein